MARTVVSISVMVSSDILISWSLDVYAAVGLLDHMSELFLTFRGASILSLQVSVLGGADAWPDSFNFFLL